MAKKQKAVMGTLVKTPVKKVLYRESPQEGESKGFSKRAPEEGPKKYQSVARGPMSKKNRKPVTVPVKEPKLRK